MRSSHIHGARVARALQLDATQLAGLVQHLPPGSIMYDDRGRQMIQASAIEAAVCGNDPAMISTFYRLVDLTPSPAAGPSDQQKVAAFQARRTVETFRSGRAVVPAPNPAAALAAEEARANARAYRQAKR